MLASANNFGRCIFAIAMGLMFVCQAQAAPRTAYFAGGCFWCMQPPYDGLVGVNSTIVGYTGGKEVDPTYEKVSEGLTGHTETVQINYDDSKISYKQLLDIFWRNIDPTVKNSQFCDIGKQYRSAIFYTSLEEKKWAEASRDVVMNKGLVVFTEIKAAGAFYNAETYHQSYYKKNPLRYKYYRYACGRDKRLKELWGEPKP